MPLSTYAANKTLDFWFRNIDMAPPATVYIAAYKSNPGDEDAGVEVAGGSYARQAMAFGTAASKGDSNNGLVNFPQATADWGLVTHVGIKDAASAGNLIAYGPLTNARLIKSGDQLIFPVSSVLHAVT